MITLFLTGFWLVAFIIAALIVLGLFTYHEQWTGTTVVAVLALLALAGFSAYNPLLWVYLHPIKALLYGAGYVAAGVVWTFIKWSIDMDRFGSEYQTEKANFYRDNKLDPAAGVPDNKYWDYEQYMKKHVRAYTGEDDIPPVVAKRKAAITNWMMWWPVSITVTVVDDYIIELYNTLYKRIAGTLQKIANKAVARHGITKTERLPR